jgi:hypothetical protein
MCGKDIMIDESWKAVIWRQFGAAIEMIENAMLACPDEVWSDRSRQPEFWYLVFHTLFWLDLYLSGAAEGFAPPPPFTLDELDPAGIIPDRPYTKDELQSYLVHGRKKCRDTIRGLTDKEAGRRFVYGSFDVTFVELLLYTMRHVQHHAAQLNLILRQATNTAPRWVRQSKGSFSEG